MVPSIPSRRAERLNLEIIEARWQQRQSVIADRYLSSTWINHIDLGQKGLAYSIW